ncbi:MAG: YbjN domain-containing protein [Paracoccaceae bacterium]
MRFLASLSVAVFLATTANLAAQEMVSPANAIDIAEALRDLGYRAQLKKDSVGDPMISSKAAGLNFSVFYYGCDDGDQCQSVQLSVMFDKEGVDSLPDLNDWNKRKRYAKAHFNDDGNIVLRYDINMSGEGISRASFNEVFDLWERLLNDFKDHIGW